jgi:transposase
MDLRQQPEWLMSEWRRGKAYSQDLRDRVLAADGVGSGQVAERFGVSASFVVKARQRRARHGQVTAGEQRSHTPPKLARHYQAVAAQVARKPDWTLEELCDWVLQELGISVSISTMWSTLRRLGLTLKKSALRQPNRRVRTLPRLVGTGTS